MMHKFRWRKLGLVYCPSSEHYWLASHAAVPIAEHISGDVFRVYFSSRDKNNASYTSFIVIDINNPQRILEVANEPVLRPGQLGEFDDSGSMGCWITVDDDKKYFYYIGWNLGVTVPFRNSIGLAVADSGAKFSRIGAGPIVDRTLNEPHFTASCCVLKDSDRWHMWYLSCTEWRIRNSIPEHRYHIKYAESKDGVIWQRNGRVAIDYLDDNEVAISRPSVIRDVDGWKMWFSCRSAFSNYSIGYAESSDGKNWSRANLCTLGPSTHGWDSEMVEYPYVFDHKGVRYMFYNGNGYGRTGFGLAVLEEIHDPFQ